MLFQTQIFDGIFQNYLIAGDRDKREWSKVGDRNANLGTYKTWWSRTRVQQCPAVLQQPLDFSLLVLLSIMLSRFSSLFVYVVAGLVISAAATPAAPPSNYDNGSKSPSYPGPSSPPSPPKYPDNKPYDDGKKNPPYPKPDDKGKSYDNGKYNGQCSVGKQQCCNQFTQVNYHQITRIC